MDMDIVYTIVSFYGLFTPYVIACLCNVIQTTPSVRNIVGTDIQRVVVDLVCLVDEQMQAVDGVATVFRLIAITVHTGRIERVTRDLCSSLFMDPYERRIHVGNVTNRVMVVLRPNIQIEGNDRIATELIRFQSIAVNTILEYEER